jgi:hypothetical protein
MLCYFQKNVEPKHTPMFTKGQKVCLWKEEVSKEGVVVVKEVNVTITDIKTGVPGEWSRKPVHQQSLRGLGDDGKVYQKHWDSWPESQTDDFMSQWSVRIDDDGEVWIPQEAAHLHNKLNEHNRRHGETHPLKRVDLQGNPILPKGDLTRCEAHDEYLLPGHKCFQCLLGRQRKA